MAIAYRINVLTDIGKFIPPFLRNTFEPRAARIILLLLGIVHRGLLHFMDHNDILRHRIEIRAGDEDDAVADV